MMFCEIADLKSAYSLVRKKRTTSKNDYRKKLGPIWDKIHLDPDSLCSYEESATNPMKKC